MPAKSKKQANLFKAALGKHPTGAALKIKNSLSKDKIKDFTHESKLPTFSNYFNEGLKFLPTIYDISKIEQHIKDNVIDCNINISDISLETLPIDLSKVHVKGYFDCKNNLLKTLKGCPYKIDSYFTCDTNDLKSLEGGPVYVSGNYVCSNNLLTSMKGLAKYIGENLLWSNNLDITKEDFYEAIVDIKIGGKLMFQHYESDVYPFEVSSSEELLGAAHAYKLYNTPLDYTIDF